MHEPTDFHKPFLISLVVIFIVAISFGVMQVGNPSGENSAGVLQSLSTKDSTTATSSDLKTNSPLPQTASVGSGNIYITDSSNHRIQKFDQNGNFILKWGSLGSGSGRFISPSDVAVDSMGYVYVADPANCQIQKFTPTGGFVLRWGSFGATNGQFAAPYGIGIDSLGFVYVADSNNNRIQKFTSSGVYVTQWGSLGTGNGQFNRPYGITITPSGVVYVVDQANGRIQKFTTSGVYLGGWGSLGTGNGQFYSPDRVVVDSLGDVYVSDDNHRIQKFDSNGTYLAQWGNYGTSNGQFNNPSGLAIDSVGTLLAVDDHNNRIQKFTTAGTYLNQWGTFGTGDGEFDLPVGIAIDHALPDLMITNVTPDPTTLHRNYTYPYISLDFTVKNVGLVPLTIPITTKFSLYGVGGIYGGMLVGQFLPGSPITLLPNQTYTFHNVNTSATPNLRQTIGYFNFKLIADESNVIDESFETNNTFGFGLTIVP